MIGVLNWSIEWFNLESKEAVLTLILARSPKDRVTRTEQMVNNDTLVRHPARSARRCRIVRRAINHIVCSRRRRAENNWK